MSVPLSPVEHIKARSSLLRGSIASSLADSATGALAEQDTHLVKFHGFYQQDNRDLRAERIAQKLEPAYSFMIRVRVPGGSVSPRQWLVMDDLAATYGNRALRITTRQAFQLHGVLKRDLKSTMGNINASLLDTFAACGDVNRNVMCSPLAELSSVHATCYETACAISRHLTPRTGAYHELWINGKRTGAQQAQETEPIYGATYLPRKFKISVAIPPVNDVDVFAQDLGFIAITQHDELLGFNVTAGGGMGMSHGEPETYPRLADVIGFCTAQDAVAVAEGVVKLQRDHGDRGNRKHARLKYTIDDRGLDWFKQELFQRLGFSLEPPRPYAFLRRGDEIGWRRGGDGLWYLTLFIPEGRVADTGTHQLAACLREIAEAHIGDFRLTPNQNLIIAGIDQLGRTSLEELLARHGVDQLQGVSPMRQQALACVALPNCPLAMAEAERYLPSFSKQMDALLEKHGIEQAPVSVRLSGCPNGCSRPYVAEVALVGRAPGSYNLLIGGSASGDRLAQVVLQNEDERGLLAYLEGAFAKFAQSRLPEESFGDFAYRRLIQGETNA